MPSIAGFCLLVRGSILDRFIQSVDEMRALGCGGEEEFLCQINRYGYSAVAANWAYVFHQKDIECNASNRKVSSEQYPEYERKVGDFLKFQIEPLETFAILHAPHRPRILYDLFHLPAMHSGTSDFGLNLLREIGRLLEGDFDLHVGIDQSLPFFANELRGYRIYDDRPGARLTFDLVYKPCQLFRWQEFNRMNRFSPRLSYTMLDIIGVRCDYLSSPARRFLFRKTAELADLIFTISEFSRSDFAAFCGAGVPMKMIHLGTDAHIMAGKFSAYEHVLVMGNAFPHKGVMEAVHHLDPSWPVVVLGGAAAPTYVTPNVRWLTSGQLSRQDIRELFAKARILIYPSHYEGFGLPVVDALALGKPVVVLDSAVNRELAKATQNHNLHLIQSIKQLQDTVRPLLDMPTSPPPQIPPRRWREVAEDYVGAFRKLLECDPDLERLRARWDLLRMIQSAGRGFEE
jgi:glycosyltransferase involved in cell wall biosynthesis